MEELINILAAKFNRSPELIEKIVRSQFRFVRDTIEEGELESVHLHHLGKFCVKPRFTKNKNYDADDK